MKKLTEEQKEEIILKHSLDNTNENIQAICKDYNITKKTIYNIINSQKNSGNSSITEYKRNYTKKLDAIITTALEKLQTQVNNEDIKAIDLTKIVGILYDKIRLEEGLSTENKAVSINIKIE